MLPPDLRKKLLAEVKAQFRIDVRGIHGAPHWARVRANGLRLAKVTGADTTVVELFAVLHDSQREDDGLDPFHGDRAAEYTKIVLPKVGVRLSVEQMASLRVACTYHSAGSTSGGFAPLYERTILTCWDADRLDLGRIGVIPDPARLCTEAGRAPKMIAWALERSVR